MFIYVYDNGTEVRCANWATAREYQLQNNGSGRIVRGMQFS
jgi:hypothetical protein